MAKLLLCEAAEKATDVRDNKPILTDLKFHTPRIGFIITMGQRINKPLPHCFRRKPIHRLAMRVCVIKRLKGTCMPKKESPKIVKDIDEIALESVMPFVFGIPFFFKSYRRHSRLRLTRGHITTKKHISRIGKASSPHKPKTLKLSLKIAPGATPQIMSKHIKLTMIEIAEPYHI